MTPLEFLSTVLPHTGRLCIASINPDPNAPKEKKTRHIFVDSPERAASAVRSIREGLNAYFACSSFGDQRNRHGYPVRTQANMVATRLLWLDLDVDATGADPQKYRSQPDAAVALRGFCDQLSLPKPLVVNSGHGLHVYWVLTEDHDFATWYVVAEKLKAVCLKLGMLIDPKCTLDAARILRVPGTMNYNHPTPLPVQVVMAGAGPVDLLAFARLLGVVETPVVATPTRLPFAKPAYITGTDALTRRLAEGDSPTSFATLVASRQCAQITFIVEHQAQVHEPMWRAGLSIARACSDWETAIHDMSSQHPGYSPEQTREKALGTTGPMTCERFDEENPGVCESCPHYGRVKSPISLARRPQSDNEAPVVVQAPTAAQIAATAPESAPATSAVVLPTYPAPFERGEGGAVIRRTSGPDGGIMYVTVYPYAFYIVGRVVDRERGDVLLARLHLPHDGVREFDVSLKDASSNDKLRDTLSANGMVIMGDTINQLRVYVLKWAEQLQTQERAGIMRPQFGWTPAETFLIGDREIRTDGVFYSPPSRSTANVAPHMVKRGTLEAWRAVANLWNAPGMEDRAFAFFAGFGAPLMRYTHMAGGVIHLYSTQPGTTKTTTQYLINSIWGHPKNLGLLAADTYNAKMHRMAVMNTLPVTVDEITDMSQEDTSSLLYSSANGREKNRLDGMQGGERANEMRWNTILISSANDSLADKLYGVKASPDGELMRLIELPVERCSLGEKNVMAEQFNAMFDNYGIAGEIYADYLVKHQATVKKILGQVQRRLDEQTGLTERERIWSAIAAAAITGGMIAYSLKLHTIDVNRVIEWTRNFFSATRESSTVNYSEHATVNLGTYLDEHAQNTLVIDGNAAPGKLTVPIRENIRALYVRIEPNTGDIYINTAHLRAWCSKHRVSFNAMLRQLRGDGIEVTSVMKRLSTSTGTVSAPVRATKFFDPQNRVLQGDRDPLRKPYLTVVSNDKAPTEKASASPQESQAGAAATQ
jgi:hypothetical protein